MSRLSSWLRGGTVAQASKSDTLTPPHETSLLEDAMSGAALLMSDDLLGADAALSRGSSAFHQLGRGITAFMRSMLGWEAEVLKEASAKLNDVENRAYTDMKKAQGEKNWAYDSEVYVKGMEFALVAAMAQLMGAMVGVFTESVAEAVRGFWKLRKAFATLNGILANEERFRKRERLRAIGNGKAVAGDVSEASKRASRDINSENLEKIPPAANGHAKASKESPDESEFEFVDANESQSGAQTPAQDYPLNDLQDLSLNGTTTAKSLPPISIDSSFPALTHPIDIFIHTGTSLCLGVLLLLLSLIPPAFSKLLSVAGFKGDRQKGLMLLWSCSAYPNINGAIAGLMLLGYYNGMLGAADIFILDSDLPPSSSSDAESQSHPLAPRNLTGYPAAACASLLSRMRALYPKSRLWLLEEARMLASSRELPRALEILGQAAAHPESESGEPEPMIQIIAITVFETAMDRMYIHDYAECTKSFLRCRELNNWSHALYVFCAAAAELELWRDCVAARKKSAAKEGSGKGEETGRDEDAAAEKHRLRAEQLFREAPLLAGRKKFMSRQLPFDLYVVRKLQKWEERLKSWKVDRLVDVIGVSPLEEMSYLWNGPKRMERQELERTLANLEWERCSSPEKLRGSKDEGAVWAVLRATALRNLGRASEARVVLEEGVLSIDKAAFKAPQADDWAPPSAYYEMAVLVWSERDDDPPLPPARSSTQLASSSSTTAAAAALQKTTTSNSNIYVPSPSSSSSSPSTAAASAAPPRRSLLSRTSTLLSTATTATMASLTPVQSVTGKEEVEEDGETTVVDEKAVTDEQRKEKRKEEWRREKIKECEFYIAKALKWEGYVLDARVGMKLGTAGEGIRVYKEVWGLNDG